MRKGHLRSLKKLFDTELPMHKVLVDDETMPHPE